MKKLWKALFLIIFPLSLSGCVSEKNEETIETAEIVEQVSDVESSSSKKQLKRNYPTIYSGDEIVNRYLARYNESNPEDLINSDMFHVYYHHGRDHDNQIKFDNKDGFEITITSHEGMFVIKDSIRIVLKNSDKWMSNDEFAYQTEKFLRPLITESTLEEDITIDVSRSSNDRIDMVVIDARNFE